MHKDWICHAALNRKSCMDKKSLLIVCVALKIIHTYSDSKVEAIFSFFLANRRSPCVNVGILYVCLFIYMDYLQEHTQKIYRCSVCIICGERLSTHSLLDFNWNKKTGLKLKIPKIQVKGKHVKTGKCDSDRERNPSNTTIKQCIQLIIFYLKASHHPRLQL